VISTSYEECRADTCGFHLVPNPEVYTIFGFLAEDVEKLLWVNVMTQLRKAILGLSLFETDTQKWG